MYTGMLLAQLLELERSIGVESNTALRKRVQDAESLVLRLQKEMAEHLSSSSRQHVPIQTEFSQQEFDEPIEPELNPLEFDK